MAEYSVVVTDHDFKDLSVERSVLEDIATVLDCTSNVGETIPDERGMYIMDTPGHGAKSVTGIGAGGAHFMVISTGQGHTLSNAVMPTIKITGNPRSAERVPEQMTE